MKVKELLMKFELRKARKALGVSAADIAKASGIVESFYRKYEKDGCIPSKYIYKIWKEYPDYPIPEDFFWYTSYTLQCNLTYHGLTQTDAAKILGLSGQPVISKYLSENIPMYEYKDKFNKYFDPLIVPFKQNIDGSLKYITELVPAGNLKDQHRTSKTNKPKLQKLIINKGDGE